jgi:hypothetical protein
MTSVEAINAQHSKNIRATIQTIEKRLSPLKKSRKLIEPPKYPSPN